MHYLCTQLKALSKLMKSSSALRYSSNPALLKYSLSWSWNLVFNNLSDTGSQDKRTPRDVSKMNPRLDSCNHKSLTNAKGFSRRISLMLGYMCVCMYAGSTLNKFHNPRLAGVPPLRRDVNFPS